MKIVTLSGWTCSGKTTLASELIKLGYHRVVTTTTREPREGEVNELDYHFVSAWEFDKLQATNNFVETNKFDNHWYGVQVSHVPTEGNSVIVCDPNGAKAIKDFYGEPVLNVWLEVSIEVAIGRLVHREFETEPVNERRLMSRLSHLIKVESTKAKSDLRYYELSGHDTPSYLARYINNHPTKFPYTYIG